MRIALFVIATNKYFQFVEPLVESVEKYFLENHKIDIFLHTNLESNGELERRFNNQNRVSCKFFHISHKPWPFMTLERYAIFNQHDIGKPLSELDNNNVYDYAFYCDVDMLFVEKVGDEILGPNLTATIHPGFFNKPRELFTYEENSESLAYIGRNEGVFYFAGGFQGGTAKAYGKAINDLATNIKKDLSNGIMAVWHDESHWNKHLLHNPPSVILSPSYCFPENWNWLPFKKRLLALDKNHEEIRK
jgi:histo-blood group ABO system transferase